MKHCTKAIPQQAIDLIKKWEGLVSSPYICSGDKLTIGYGHLIKEDQTYGGFEGKHIFNVLSALRSHSNSRLILSKTLKAIFPDLITEDKAEVLLIEDIFAHYSEAMRLVDVKLYDTQRAAICSFVYNLGVTNFRKSTLLKKLNAGDYVGAAGEFERWVNAGGKRLQGLVSRRLEEKELFLMKVVA